MDGRQAHAFPKKYPLIEVRKHRFGRSCKKNLRSRSQSNHSPAVDVPENGRHLSRNVPSRPLGTRGHQILQTQPERKNSSSIEQKRAHGAFSTQMGVLHGARLFAEPNFTAAPKDPVVRRPWAGQTQTPRSLAIDSPRCPKTGSWCGSQRGPLLR